MNARVQRVIVVDGRKRSVVSHRRCSRGKREMLLEGSSRVNDWVALHLESIQRKGNARVAVSMAAGGGVGMVECVLVEVQVSINPNARDMG